MTTHVNETARNLTDALRRYVSQTASRYRPGGRHAGLPGNGQGPVLSREALSRQVREILQRAKGCSTPARKTAALGTGASLLLTGMVFGVAEAATVAAPETVADRQLVTRPFEEPEPAQEAPAQEAPAEGGTGSTAPVTEEAPAKPSVPVDGLVITSPFGWRLNPITGYGQEWHTGTDFRGALGTDVRSARTGTVTEAGWHTTGGGGLRIVVDHGDGVLTTYNHLNDIWVEPGQQVEEGQVIGAVGSTGNSTGPHLHFEVLINGEYIDPMSWL
ncbi:M23 family metallopeptidase [Arthrobacter luteolus]|uniref:M23 family metallopeptidase n=1 Tax=Arthrobacter luteolus TaxID=98672 RepID=UPI003850BC88